MEKQQNKLKLTVQGVINPVPAAEGGGDTGPRSSISSDCINNNKNNIGEIGNTTPLSSAISWSDMPLLNPFGRSSVIKRTPPSGSTTVNEDQAQNLSTQGTVNSKDMLLINRSAFAEMGEMITDLMEFIKNRNNVHHAIKDKVRGIKVMFNKIRDETPKEVNDTLILTDAAQVSTFEKETQTSPQDWPKEMNGKRNREGEGTGDEPKTAPKRQKQAAKEKNVDENTSGGKETPQTAPTSGKEGWQRIRRTKRKRRKRPKPDAVIISARGETSYADILRKIRTDPELNSLGEEVNKIRRTLKGDLLLELKTAGSCVAERFNDKLVSSLSGCAEVKSRKEETLIECKDLDDITTESEICAALTHQLNLTHLDVSIVKSLRKTPMGMQTARICLPSTAACKALELGKIKIGWSVCRLKEVQKVTKCFKCLEYGHIAKFCKSEYDRSKCCRKCGEEGHFAKNCVSEAMCMLCKSNGAGDIRHFTGSYKCPMFRKALSDNRK